MSDPIEQLIYYSLWRPQIGGNLDSTVNDILATSVAHNSKVQITGALLACNGWFVQALEGDHAPVHSLYAAIQRDRRHEVVTLVGVRPAPRRVFPRWSMCGANLSETDAALVRVIGRHQSFSPPVNSFENALRVLESVQEMQDRGILAAHAKRDSRPGK